MGLSLAVPVKVERVLNWVLHHIQILELIHMNLSSGEPVLQDVKRQGVVLFRHIVDLGPSVSDIDHVPQGLRVDVAIMESVKILFL